MILLVAAGVGGVLYGQRNKDSLRTVKNFPVEEYFSDYHSTAGGTFKITGTVTADLGWKEETGRLMVFTVGDGNERRLTILLAPALSDIHFSKGQRYQVAFKVLEGGLLYADSCTKL